MKFKLGLLILAMCFNNLSYAGRCQIEKATASQLQLSSSYLSQAATSFSVACDSNYAIKFSSRNLTSPAGNSYLVSDRNHKIRTQMFISGATSSRWNTPISQPAADQTKFVVLVQLAEQPTASTPAGLYKDSLYVSLIY